MVGNDIIDIRLANQQSDWQRKGFVEKVFTQEEQLAINSSEDPFGTVWRIWSMKESAYKLYLQTGQERFFNPLHLSCEIISSEKGIVYCEELKIYTRTKFNSKFIFTSVSSSSMDNAEDQVFYIPKSDYHFQSEFTHRQILKCIARKFDLNIYKLKIRKTNQKVPEVVYNKQKLDFCFSLTHHGNYGAFSYVTHRG